MWCVRCFPAPEKGLAVSITLTPVPAYREMRQQPAVALFLSAIVYFLKTVQVSRPLVQVAGAFYGGIRLIVNSNTVKLFLVCIYYIYIMSIM